MSQSTYQLLDSGDGRKLERVGPYLIERQAAVAFWRKRLDAAEWRGVDALHHRSETGGGHWEQIAGRAAIPDTWNVEYGGLSLRCKLTSFGHLGFFAEQAFEWDWLRQALAQTPSRAEPVRVLNLFAYTGGSSLALSLGGAEVTHVDAAKGIVDWARANAELNAVPAGRLRFVVEDCAVFLRREERRGRLYDAVVMDPPSFGRGPNKEVFKIEEHIQELLRLVARVLKPRPDFFHFSCHSPGFTPEVLKNLLADQVDLSGMTIDGGEMRVPEGGKFSSTARALPSGYCLRARQSGNAKSGPA